MDISSAVGKIRKQKNISIKDTIGNNMSRSTYNRYINGQTDLYSIHFLQLINQLHITLDELLLISNNYSDLPEKSILKRIKECFEKGEINELKFLKKTCRKKYEEESNIVFSHLAALIDILISRITHEEINIENNELFTYLINTETWTRYELIMFNNSMFYFNPDALSNVLPRALINLQKTTKNNLYADESFRMLTNAVIAFIHNQCFEEAVKYIGVLTEQVLLPDQAYEKILKKMFEGIRLFLIGDPKGEQIIDKCLDIMSFLEMDGLKYMFEKALLSQKDNLK